MIPFTQSNIFYLIWDDGCAVPTLRKREGVWNLQAWIDLLDIALRHIPIEDYPRAVNPNPPYRM